MARLGVAPIVLGHVANHRTTTRAGVTLAVYSQYTYDKEKREALDLWAGHLRAIVGDGAVVLSLKRGKREGVTWGRPCFSLKSGAVVNGPPNRTFSKLKI